MTRVRRSDDRYGAVSRDDRHQLVICMKPLAGRVGDLQQDHSGLVIFDQPGPQICPPIEVICDLGGKSKSSLALFDASWRQPILGKV